MTDETEIKKLTARLDKLEKAVVFLEGLSVSYITHRNNHDAETAAVDDALDEHDKAIDRLTKRLDKLKADYESAIPRLEAAIKVGQQ